jgi:hypothetical protein
MVKWFALVIALVALTTAADERKTSAEFTTVEDRLKAVEGAECTLLQVMTPSGRVTICAKVHRR